MNRRRLLKLGAAGLGVAAARPSLGFVPAHNWAGYDWGTAPPVADRLDQGPFPQYAPEEVLPGSEVVMATTPSRDVVPNFGMGLVTYVTGDFGGATFRGLDMEREIEAFAALPLGQKLYVRPTWRELQKRPGRLDPDPYWRATLAMAKQYGKRVGFRVMMSDPDIEEPSLPDFVLEKVPMVQLRGGEWKRGTHPPEYFEPRYDHPYFQDAFRELNALLAAEFDGSPLVEYVDTFMYGFWGEGHTWPFTDNPFPDSETAERTFVKMMDVQLEHWKRTPLATNTQPDWSRVGNSELVDRTIRSHNWLRTDTIFIENEQIEAISNRPPWVAGVVEVGMSDGSPESLKLDEGIPYTDNVIAHVMDVGANYWSLWNWHAERAANVASYYDEVSGDDRHDRAAHRLPRAAVVHLALRGSRRERPRHRIRQRRHCGRARACCAWKCEAREGKLLAGGGLDPGYPLPGKIRQARFALPPARTGRGCGSRQSSK